MKKVLVINTKYKKYGGEDSNFVEEIKFLNKFYVVEYLNFDNSEKLNIFDILVFYSFKSINKQSTEIKLNSFKPDIVYIHNTWFKAISVFLIF